MNTTPSAPVSILQQEIADGIVYGGAILAGKEASVFCDCGVGHTSPERSCAMDTDTVLDVASTTKAAAVITALLICHRRGLIDFDAPFTEYLEDFSAPLYEPISIRDLAVSQRLERADDPFRRKPANVRHRFDHPLRRLRPGEKGSFQDPAAIVGNGIKTKNASRGDREKNNSSAFRKKLPHSNLRKGSGS